MTLAQLITEWKIINENEMNDECVWCSVSVVMVE